MYNFSSKSIQGPEPSYDLYSLEKQTYNLFKNESPFKMHVNKGVLPQFQLAYETWGELNKEKDNAILLFTGLSATSHAKSNSVSLILNTKFQYFKLSLF